MSTVQPELTLAVHPGDRLAQELGRRGLTQSDLARAMGYPRSTINSVIRGYNYMTPVFALCLEEALPGLPAESWLATSAHYQVSVLRSLTDY